VTGLGRVPRASAQTLTGEVAVYPTGQYPFDLYEVGAAVNGGIGPSGRSYPGGGVVRLKATNDGGMPMFFNFGDGTSSPVRGSIAVTRDVVIVGELTGTTTMTFPNGRVPDTDFAPDRTVVYGGKRAFACPAENSVPTTLAVRNIYFAYPSLAAVQVRKSAGLEVSDCVIYDVEWDATGLGFSVAVGVEATGLAQANPALFGDYRVMNNRIRRAAPTTSPVNFFIADTGIVMNLSSMNGQIIGNEIDRFPFVGIGIDRNNGTVTIAGNYVSHCGYGGYPTSAGIGARGTSMPVFIERNQVTGGDVGPALRSKNGFSLSSSNVVVRSNSVEGAVSQDGILLTSFTPAPSGPTYTASKNVIEKNRLIELVAGRSEVFFDVGCDGNRSANNDYGELAVGGLAGMVVSSNDNQLVNEDFWGTYTGVNGSPSLPCVWLTEGSNDNQVSALKYQGAPQGFDVCIQVRDDGTNAVNGAERCQRGR
jgi:hypothetical protein